MTARIAVDVDLVSAHTSRVYAIASDVASAGDAAGATDIGGGAFGVLCGFLVAPVAVVASAAGLTIRAAEAMVERSATELRGATADLDAFEDDTMRDLAALERHLG